MGKYSNRRDLNFERIVNEVPFENQGEFGRIVQTTRKKMRRSQWGVISEMGLVP
jgi:hypothetical protein